MANCQEDRLEKRELDPCSPAYSFLRKQAALNCLSKGQQREAAFNLSEALAISFRTQATLSYDTVVGHEENLFEKLFMELNLEDVTCNQEMDKRMLKFGKEMQQNLLQNSLANKENFPLNKKHIKHNYSDEEGIKIMMNQIKNLPKEWNVVQITKGEYNETKFTHTVPDAFKEMSNMFITVYSSDEMRRLNIEEPITVTVTPTDVVAGNSLFEQYHTFLSSFKEGYNAGLQYSSDNRRVDYWKKMDQDNSDLKKYIDELESLIGGWKVLLLGNLLENQSVLQQYHNEVDNIIKDNEKSFSNLKITSPQKYLLYRLSEICSSLSLVDIKHVLNHVLPGESFKMLRASLCKAMKYSEAFKVEDLKNCERGPVILIIDEMLDNFPWEMLSIFEGQPVCRGVSLNVIYALYEKHKKDIVDGYYMVENKHGRYILNPDDNLEPMEKRMIAFMKYWLPQWTGSSGLAVDRQTFIKFLEESSIFLYCGHGSGCQHIEHSKIEKLNLKNVVFLAGCSSVATSKPGRKTEGGGTHMNYHIGCSPCVIGNLWIVTDRDSDRLMTKILSTWLPSFHPNIKHFKDINMEKWQNKYQIDTKTTGKKLKYTKYLKAHNDLKHEKDLLKVVAYSRGVASNFKNACAIIARGIPVKLM